MLLPVTKLYGANLAVEQTQYRTFELFTSHEDSHYSNVLSENDLSLKSLLRAFVRRHLADNEGERLTIADGDQTPVPIIDDMHLHDYLRVCFRKRWQYAPFFFVLGKLSSIKSSADSGITLTINH